MMERRYRRRNNQQKNEREEWRDAAANTTINKRMRERNDGETLPPTQQSTKE